MKKQILLFLVFCLVLIGCGSDSGKVIVEETTTTTTRIEEENAAAFEQALRVYSAQEIAQLEEAKRRSTTTVSRSKPRATTPTTKKPVVTTKRPAPATVNVAQGDRFEALAACESTGDRDGVAPHRINIRAVSPTGKHRGAFQFSIATWQSVGETGDPINYSYEHQKAAAQRLQARSGWGQWPDCSSRLGYR